MEVDSDVEMPSAGPSTGCKVKVWSLKSSDLAP